MIHQIYAQSPIKMIRVNPGTYCCPVFLLIPNKYKVILLIHSSSSKRDGQAKVKTTLLAYATNDDPDSPGYPMINLCEGFFTRRSLADAISFGNAHRYPEKARLSNYENRGALFLVSQIKAF